MSSNDTKQIKLHEKARNKCDTPKDVGADKAKRARRFLSPNLGIRPDFPGLKVARNEGNLYDPDKWCLELDSVSEPAHPILTTAHVNNNLDHAMRLN